MAYMSMGSSVELLATVYSVMLPSATTTYVNPRERRVRGRKAFHQSSADHCSPTRVVLLSNINKSCPTSTYPLGDCITSIPFGPTACRTLSRRKVLCPNPPTRRTALTSALVAEIWPSIRLIISLTTGSKMASTSSLTKGNRPRRTPRITLSLRPVTVF